MTILRKLVILSLILNFTTLATEHITYIGSITCYNSQSNKTEAKYLIIRKGSISVEKLTLTSTFNKNEQLNSNLNLSLIHI